MGALPVSDTGEGSARGCGSWASPHGREKETGRTRARSAAQDQEEKKRAGRLGRASKPTTAQVSSFSFLCEFVFQTI
jgi:hypothetical protein